MARIPVGFASPNSEAVQLGKRLKEAREYVGRQVIGAHSGQGATVTAKRGAKAIHKIGRASHGGESSAPCLLSSLAPEEEPLSWQPCPSLLLDGASADSTRPKTGASVRGN